MAGSLKLDGNEFLVKEGGQFKITNSELKLKSSGNTVVDSSGNALISEANGVVTMSDKMVPANSFMFRNKLINGNFDFWQRGTSQTSSGYESADRWASLHVGSSKTASQQSFTNGQTDVPNNPRFYFRHAVTSSSGNGNYVQFYQAIEDVRILAGKTVTLSFYAKADSNKNIATEFTQWFGTGGSPSSWNTGLSVTTHNLTTSWQKFTVTTVIPSISGKTIGSDENTSYTGIYFHFDAGSNFNARTNSLGQQSGTFDIAQVQLEEGSSATPFEHRPAGLEFSLCQRYYQIRNIFTSTTTHAATGNYGNGACYSDFNLSTDMRASPSLVIYQPTQVQLYNNSGSWNNVTLLPQTSKPDVVGVYYGDNSNSYGGLVRLIGYASSTYPTILCSAEL